MKCGIFYIYSHTTTTTPPLPPIMGFPFRGGGGSDTFVCAKRPIYVIFPPFLPNSLPTPLFPLPPFPSYFLLPSTFLLPSSSYLLTFPAFLSSPLSLSLLRSYHTLRSAA